MHTVLFERVYRRGVARYEKIYAMMVISRKYIDSLGYIQPATSIPLAPSPQRILPLRRNRSIQQRHPDLLPQPLRLPILRLTDACSFFLQDNGNA